MNLVLQLLSDIAAMEPWFYHQPLWPHNQDFVHVIKHIVVFGYATAADDY